MYFLYITYWWTLFLIPPSLFFLVLLNSGHLQSWLEQYTLFISLHVICFFFVKAFNIQLMCSISWILFVICLSIDLLWLRLVWVTYAWLSCMLYPFPKSGNVIELRMCLPYNEKPELIFVNVQSKLVPFMKDFFCHLRKCDIYTYWYVYVYIHTCAYEHGN